MFKRYIQSYKRNIQKLNICAAPALAVFKNAAQAVKIAKNKL